MAQTTTKTTTMTGPKTVILWVHPRSTSTAFECAVLQRPKEFRVLHEPMGDAWYFGSERVSDRYSQETCDKDFKHYKDSSFRSTWSNIHSPPSSGPARTFSKDMALHIFPLDPHSSSASSFSSSVPPSSDGNPTLIPTSSLLHPSIIHTFLIRTPKKAIPSYHRLCFPGSETGFEYFDPKEAGYKELRKLFDFVKANTKEIPLVLESDDMLKEPEKVMKRWCDEVEIEFDVGMLSWGEGTREHFAKWPGFHSSAENSQGIGKGLKPEHCTPSNHNSPTQTPKPQPQVVLDCIEENMKDYEYLKGFVRRP